MGAAIALAAAGLAAAGVVELLRDGTDTPAVPAALVDAGAHGLRGPAPAPDAQPLEAAVPAPSSLPELAPEAAPARRASPPRDSRGESRVAATLPVVPAPSAPPPPAPGEAEFRAGWSALKAGEANKAAASFAASRQATGSVLAEDASFWEGIALARAGRAPEAIAALRRFVASYSSSSRAGEASAKLGWLLYERGDLDAARAAFLSAVDDVVPRVKDSARAGLEALARKQRAP